MGRKSQWMWVKVADGDSLTTDIRAQTEQRILSHAQKILPKKASQIRVRFHADYCYLDADEGSGPPLTHLCRLGWEGDPEAWSLAFYTYSNEKYQACMFGSGKMLGTPEEALRIGAVYLG